MGGHGPECPICGCDGPTKGCDCDPRFLAMYEELTEERDDLQMRVNDLESMGVYEVVTDHCGEAYVRAYAWARSEEEAAQLVRERNPDAKESIRDVRRVLAASASPFATEYDDAGWPEAEG